MLQMVNYITILLFLYFFTNLVRVLYYYQNDNYHIRVFKNLIINDIKKRLIIYILLFILFLNNNVLNIIILLLLFIFNIKHIKKIVKIKYTKRMKRLFLLVLCTMPLIVLLEKKYIILIIFNIIYIFIIFLYTQISAIMECLINIKYYKKAKKKIEKYNPFIIGITGSCGKTSVKNYIYECLKNNYMIYKSPKSYNTLKGLTLTINEKLNLYDSYFILEMGLSHKKDISKITKYYKPDISIITELLSSHLETMKTMDAIIAEKMNIVKKMKKGGVIIINNDNKLISENIQKFNINNNRVIKVGIDNVNDIYASNIIVKTNGLEFDIINNLNASKYHINNSLIGRHNIINVLITYAVLFIFNVKYDTLNDLCNYENRLEVKKYKNMTILNDSYNSNYEGFKSALEVLSLFNTKKIIITPGIVEAGMHTFDVISKIARKIIYVCDYCYIIDNKNTRIFTKIFNENGYKNYTIKRSFFEAFSEVKNEQITLLIENDLTDYYFIK